MEGIGGGKIQVLYGREILSPRTCERMLMDFDVVAVLLDLGRRATRSFQALIQQQRHIEDLNP